MILNLKKIAETNLNKINVAISKMGYSDGITEGRESVFQKGFDVGYENGFKSAFQITKFKSCAQILRTENDSIDRNVNREAKLFLQDPKNYDKHFSCENNRNLSLNMISKNQNEHLEQQLNKLKNNFPNLSNLLE